MVTAFRKAGVPLFVAYYRRGLPRFLKVRELVASGVIGKLLMSRASLHEHWYNYQNHVAATDWTSAA